MAVNNDMNYSSVNDAEPRSGPFLARVINHLDNTYMGSLEVEILRPVGNQPLDAEIHQVKYMSPFYGATAAFHTTNDNDYNGTQKSYGMWFVPPDVGTTVVVIFIDGDPTKGFWIGCVQDYGMNFMVPGLASTQKVVEDVDGDKQGRYGRVPVAEYNKRVDDPATDLNVSSILKPKHPFADVLTAQGLVLDDVRGITTSSARREVPSMVFGVSTPGPKDRSDGAPKGYMGRASSPIPDAFVSRLGGSTFVMDDGDPRFLRKKPAKEGPPEYADLDNGETDGDPKIPHNELIRLRTRTGHQILLHNSEDLIYITNSRGTSWIELTSDGKIDIYAQDSISVRTEKDFNFHADRDINMFAGRNFNMKVVGNHQTDIGGNKVVIVDGNNNIKVAGTFDETVEGAKKVSLNATWDVSVSGQANITVGGGLDINTSGDNKLTSGGNMEIGAANTTISGGNINLNGPGAASAGSAAAATAPEGLATFENPTETEGGTVTSIMLRVPTTEPYPHHENLNPLEFKSDKTDVTAGAAIPVPELWQVYSTNTDTFKVDPPPATEEEQNQSPGYE